MAATPALDLASCGRSSRSPRRRVGERVGRTQSAVSCKSNGLRPWSAAHWFVRGKGGGVELTAHGTALVERGRALLALNDDILKVVQAQPAHAAVRLGFD
jgi:DNA-binding transcriptional LysR family regulator